MRDLSREARGTRGLHRGAASDHDSRTRQDAGGGVTLNPRQQAELVLDPPGIELLDAVAEAAKGSLGAAIFFGSRSSGVATNPNSAYDLMLVCEDPRRFYRAMSSAGLLHRSPVLLGILDRLLPPTQIRLVRAPWLVKASVLSLAALERATSARRQDQFIAGRLFQDVHVVWAADPQVAARVAAAIDSARRVTLEWAGPDLPSSFGPSDYLRQLFRTSFRFEVRPENRGRADALSAAQAVRLEPIFDEVLRSLAAEGRLRSAGEGRYALADSVSKGAARRRRLFMEWSRIRATARWPKHAVTFDGWLDYIILKAERHSGETIVLTPLERRFPFVFLWPRALKFLARQRGKGRPV